MIRQIGTSCPAFVLETPNSSYAMRVLPSGHVEHLYYGEKLRMDRMELLDALSQKRAFPPGNTVSYSAEYPNLILEDTCLEFSSLGKGDLREPFVSVVHADGSRTSDFLFDRAEILGEKPPLETLPGSYSDTGKCEHLTLYFSDRQYKLSLELHYDVYPDCDCICRSSRLLNNSAETVVLERLLSTQLDLPNAGWAVSSFHGAWIREMQRSVTTIAAGKYVISSRAGTSSSRANPFFMLHAPETTETAGACYGFNLVYSGNHYEAVEVSAFCKTRIVSGINPEGFSFVLDPGEKFEAPEAVMSYSANGFTGLSLQMHRFVREHIVRGSWKNRPRPVLLNSWEGMYFNISESSLVSVAREGRNIGAELFVMDDGWFGERNDDQHSLGDWEPNPKKLPNGLKGLCKKINALGLGFGIWVEPEMVSVQSRLYEAHPDWAMAIPGKEHAEGRNQRFLDLCNPEVQDYIIEKMTEVFSSADIRYVKWDCNRVFSDVYAPSLPPEKQGETAHRYVCGLYRVIKTLCERFPEILFEGCAAGGNRFDLGILCYFPQIWASDNTDAVCRAQIQEGYSYGYPLSVLSAHVSASPNHQTLRETPFETRFNVAAFALLGYEYDLRDLRTEKRRELTEQITLYKQWREVLQFGDFYRGRTGNLHEWTCVSQDRKKAVGLLAQEMTKPNEPSERYVARGLDENTRYRFYNIPKSINIKHFGSLINTASPIHIPQDSLIHNVAARVVRMPGEEENTLAYGSTLMCAGISLKQAYTATGFDENVRIFADFFSRLYFMEADEG